MVIELPSEHLYFLPKISELYIDGLQFTFACAVVGIKTIGSKTLTRTEIKRRFCITELYSCHRRTTIIRTAWPFPGRLATYKR